MYGNTGAAGGLTSSANTDKRATLNAYAMLGATKIGAAVVDRKMRAVTGPLDSDLYYLGVSHPLTAAVVLDAGGTVGAGKTQNGLMGGLRHSF